MLKKVLFLNKLKGNFLSGQLIDAFVDFSETSLTDFVQNLVPAQIVIHLETNCLLIYNSNLTPLFKGTINT